MSSDDVSKDQGSGSVPGSPKRFSLPTFNNIVPIESKPLTKQEEAVQKLKLKLELEEKSMQVAVVVDALYQTERTNMLNMLKIGIKTLIETSIGFSSVGDDHNPLKQFCILIEEVLKHGFKAPTTMRQKLYSRKGLWGMIEGYEKFNTSASECCQQVRNLVTLKSNVGRVRAWIRISLQMKYLPDIIRDLVENEMFMSDWYEPWGFMLAEDATVVFAGLLVSANTVDCKFDLDPYMLDGLPSVIDYSLYLKDGNYLKPATEIREDGGDGGRYSESNFVQLNDQKSLLEERNRVLEDQMVDVNTKLEDAIAGTTPLREKLTSIEVNNEELKVQAAQAVDALAKLQTEFDQKIESQGHDMATERETYEQSRVGLNEMFDVLQKQLETERALREDVEIELQSVHLKKKELELTIEQNMIELDRRQEVLDALRQQLKDTKDMNMTMLTNVQDAKLKVQDTEAALAKSMKSNEKLLREQQQLMDKYQEGAKKRQQLESTILELSSRLQDLDAQRAALDGNLAIERQYRSTLQEEIEKEKAKNGKLGEVADKLEKLQREHTMLQVQNEDLQSRFAEQEQTLVEMGSHFSEEKLKLNEIETKRKVTRTHTWTGDNDAVCCKLCERAFSVTRRRHHCRNCGGIFCHDCSDNKMPLVSSAKPVRVCDNCERELLREMSKA
eukprot:m.68776 g.68776  ORF g.68776 m.68776 type:complete len:671 (-) comp23991_c0_seq3:62-2074(-)